MAKEARQLNDLEGVGEACLKDFVTLGIHSVSDLSTRDPLDLYRKLEKVTHRSHDICVLDTLRCAVAQAKNPHLPPAQRKWWYWSKMRKIKDRRNG